MEAESDLQNIVLNKIQDVQKKVNNCINIPSSQTFKSYFNFVQALFTSGIVLQARVRIKGLELDPTATISTSNGRNFHTCWLPTFVAISQVNGFQHFVAKKLKTKAVHLLSGILTSRI
jgi:hypothetical protein